MLISFFAEKLLLAKAPQSALQPHTGETADPTTASKDILLPRGRRDDSMLRRPITETLSGETLARRRSKTLDAPSLPPDGAA